MNIISIWKNELLFNMNLLKDKICYLRNVKYKLNKSVGRYMYDNWFNSKKVSKL